MSESQIVLQALHDALAKVDPEVIGGLELKNDSLWAFQNNLRLEAIVYQDPDAHTDSAHCHIVSHLGNDTSGNLDACIVGFGDNRESAIRDAAKVWVQVVGGPVFSMLNARPVLGAEHFDGSQIYGVAGSHGFVGTLIGRLLPGAVDLAPLIELNVFDYADAMAPPGMMHLAKTTMNASPNGWTRHVEINGHRASHLDNPWPVDFASPQHGIAIQFALFHYGDNPAAVAERQEIDDAIRGFVAKYAETRDLFDAEDRLAETTVGPELAHDISNAIPIAFGRVMFGDIGVEYPRDYIRITRDGLPIDGLHLMRNPVFARCKMLAFEIQESDVDSFKEISLLGAEINTINNAMNAGSEVSDLTLYPTIMSDYGVSNEAVDRVFQSFTKGEADAKKELPSHAKPWWKVW